MSNNTLKKWIDEFNQLLINLTNKLQLEEDASQPQGLSKFLQLNQMVYDKQDLYVMRYKNDKFGLSQYSHSTRYQEIHYPVKLIETGREISQLNYSNSIFEFTMSEDKAILQIKQQFKGNVQNNNEQFMIKEVFIGYLAQNILTLCRINNLDICKQVAFHPLNNRYILILQTTQFWNRYHAHSRYSQYLISDQYFYVYEIQNPKSPKLRLNLQNCMKGEAQAFCFSAENDENEFFLYFINSFGEIFYYNLILSGMNVSLNTRLYLKKNFPELARFEQQEKQPQNIQIVYDCTTSDEYQNHETKFNAIEQNVYNQDPCQNIILTKMGIKDFHLFVVINQKTSGVLSIQILMGEDLQKIYEIQKNEVTTNYTSKNGPKIAHDKNNVVHVAQNQFDLPNRYQLILTYNNALIIVDYSNIIQEKFNQSPVSVTSIELNHSLQIGSQQETIQQYSIKQALCLDLFNTKSILLKAITEEGKSFYYLLSHIILLSITEQNEEQNKNAFEHYKEKNIYDLNKKALKSLKSQLRNIRENQISQCKTEEDVIKLNEKLQSNFSNSINRIAIRIRLESENMFNDIDLKISGDLQEQANKNIQLQKLIQDKNEEIHSLLQQLQKYSSSVIHLQLKNQQKKADLEQYEAQIKSIDDNVMNLKTQLEAGIKDSKRTENDILVIERNLIHQIQAQKYEKKL